MLAVVAVAVFFAPGDAIGFMMGDWRAVATVAMVDANAPRGMDARRPVDGSNGGIPMPERMGEAEGEWERTLGLSVGIRLPGLATGDETGAWDVDVDVDVLAAVLGACDADAVVVVDVAVAVVVLDAAVVERNPARCRTDCDGVDERDDGADCVVCEYMHEQT